MRIEHFAMYVRNLEKAKDFFSKYFGAVSGDRYQNAVTGFSSYFLHFDDGARLEIMHRTDLSKVDEPEVQYSMGYNHIAFSVGSKERVDSLTENLKRDGYKILSEPRTTGDGYYESCIIGVDNNIIEITE